MMRCCSNCGWLEVNPSGAMFCGYSDERTWKDEICQAWKDKYEPKTNADRIRAMSDEELAELFDSWIQDCDCNDVPCRKSCEENNEKSVSGCINHWLDWLKEEAKDER